MSSFWGCLLMLLILYLQPIAPIFPGLEEDHSCLLKGSTRNCCKQENLWTFRVWGHSRDMAPKNLLTLREQVSYSQLKETMSLTQVYLCQQATTKLLMLSGISQYLQSRLPLYYRFVFRISIIFPKKVTICLLTTY